MSELKGSGSGVDLVIIIAKTTSLEPTYIIRVHLALTLLWHSNQSNRQI